MTFSTETIVRRIDGVLFVRLDDEMLAVDAERGFLYAMNDSAGRVWDLIQAPIAVGDVCARLLREYAVDEAACRGAVIGLLEGLNDAGLLEVHDAAAPAGR